MGCTIYYIILISLVIYLEIICMHSCKCTKIKCHTPSVFSFHLFFLLIQVVSFEETHVYYCILGIHHILCLIVHALLWLKCHGGWFFALICHLPLSSKCPFYDISLMMCLRLITLVHTYVLFCVSWSWILDMQFF